MSTDNSERPGFSVEARDRLARELNELRNRRAAQTADTLSLDTTGDREDGADPLRQEDDIARVDDRIAELSALLEEGPTALSTADSPSDVPDGTTVTLRFGDGVERTLRVVAVTEEIAPGDEDNTTTTDSPLAAALSGKHAGDPISYSTPAGAVRAEIVSLELP
ncbi:MAG TPA: GreA/GreB family elongation factor [Pseudonocardiaceae bacterium]|nr:GreA/GreB family elongation factor [Pseudonocardiaceae bacterium]